MPQNDWEAVIGLEVHAQLRTRSKIFSGAATTFGAEPNRQACAIDLAMPGVLPVLNQAVVECAIRFGLATGACIAPRSVFARKNYFYPDLPKGYQISQFELPVVNGGSLTIQLGDSANPYEKCIQLTRAHLEEDAGKSLHEDFHAMSGIDLNRAGTPLLEIVSEPQMNSSAEAVAYARALHALVRWIDICDGNMQEGSFRCDANVSVRRRGQPLGTRREIKNLNSFRFLQQAIDFEIAWQIDTLEEGGHIQQATVLFDPENGCTRVMRSKEDAHDYRYFPDPDLLPLCIDAAWIEQVRRELPELPAAMQQRLIEQYDLSAYDATTLTAARETAVFFQTTLDIASRSLKKPRQLAKLCANWITGELAARINKEGKSIAHCPIQAQQLAELVIRIADQTLSNNTARQVFEVLWQDESNGSLGVDAIIEQRGLKQMNDSSAIDKLVDEVIATQQKSVAEFHAGKEKAMNALVGQVMKASQGKANPAQVNALIRQKLAK